MCSMCIKINKVGKQEVGIWWVQKRFPRYGVPIWSLWPNIRFLPSIVAEKNVHICSMCIKKQLGRQTGSRNLTGPKTLPTIWYTYMTLVTKYQIYAINSYWEKCDEKYLGRMEGQMDRGKTVYPTPPSGSGGIKIYTRLKVNIIRPSLKICLFPWTQPWFLWVGRSLGWSVFFFLFFGKK